MTLTLELSDDVMKKLQERAEQSHVSPEDWLRTQVETWLHQPDLETPPSFDQAADYVLNKNAELYRRLA